MSCIFSPLDLKSQVISKARLDWINYHSRWNYKPCLFTRMKIGLCATTDFSYMSSSFKTDLFKTNKGWNSRLMRRSLLLSQTTPKGYMSNLKKIWFWRFTLSKLMASILFWSCVRDMNMSAVLYLQRQAIPRSYLLNSKRTKSISCSWSITTVLSSCQASSIAHTFTWEYRWYLLMKPCKNWMNKRNKSLIITGCNRRKKIRTRIFRTSLMISTTPQPLDRISTTCTTCSRIQLLVTNMAKELTQMSSLKSLSRLKRDIIKKYSSRFTTILNFMSLRFWLKMSMQNNKPVVSKSIWVFTREPRSSGECSRKVSIILRLLLSTLLAMVTISSRCISINSNFIRMCLIPLPLLTSSHTPSTCLECLDQKVKTLDNTSTWSKASTLHQRPWSSLDTR